MRRTDTAILPNGLSAIGMRKAFGARVAVADVDIHVRAGEIVGLLGVSGSGKSTIFNMITGLVTPDAGTFHVGGRDVTDATVDARARMGIGYVPQSPALFPKLSVEDNLQIAVEASGIEPGQGQAKLNAVLRAFGIAETRTSKLATLSGGQRRWVEIAFAMCGRPRYLLLDEPFAALDPIVSAQLSAFLAKLARLGLGILVTDHNVRHVMKSVGRIYLIDNGAILASGPAARVIEQHGVRSSFLGEDFRL